MIKRVIGLHFSPLGGTAKIIERITRDLAIDLDSYLASDVEYACYDMMEAINEQPVIDEEAVVIIGMPVHIGKIPLPAIRLLRELNGKGALTIALVSYGTATYGNALYELYSYAEERGFTIIGAGAFIAKHGRKNSVHLLRPDLDDIEAMEEFCRAISHKLKRLSGSEVAGLRLKPAPLMIEGKMPVHKVSRFSPRAAEVAEHTFERANIVIRRKPEWFL